MGISRADALDVACFLFQSFYFIFLLQSDDVQRAGWNLYRSTILLCSYVVFYRIDVSRVVDGVLLQTVLGRKADEFASLDLLARRLIFAVVCSVLVLAIFGITSPVCSSSVAVEKMPGRVFAFNLVANISLPSNLAKMLSPTTFSSISYHLPVSILPGQVATDSWHHSR